MGSEAAESTVVPATALVHDYLLSWRGAERAFATAASLWPQAAIGTLLYDHRLFDPVFGGRQIRTSPLQRLGIRQASFRRLLPAYPAAVSRIPLDEFELVVSSSSAFAHGVRTSPGAVHVCYCYTPFRYAWHERDLALAEVDAPLRPVLNAWLAYFRHWDKRRAASVDHYIAQSETVRQRIRECYGRDATVVHPPVAVDRFTPSSPGDYLLVVGEFVRHKRIEIALEAARLAGVPIRVVGAGPEREGLIREYGSSAEFLGRVSDEELAELYARCLAVVIPTSEDFGIVAVEAQASGRPAVGPLRGGLRETVVDGETGVLIDDFTPAKIAEVVRETNFERFDPAACVENARRFAPERFAREFRQEVGRVFQERFHGRSFWPSAPVQLPHASP